MNTVTTTAVATAALTLFGPADVQDAAMQGTAWSGDDAGGLQGAPRRPRDGTRMPWRT